MLAENSELAIGSSEARGLTLGILFPGEVIYPSAGLTGIAIEAGKIRTPPRPGPAR